MAPAAPAAQGDGCKHSGCSSTSFYLALQRSSQSWPCQRLSAADTRDRRGRQRH